MPGSSIMCCPGAGVAESSDRNTAVPSNLKRVMDVLPVFGLHGAAVREVIARADHLFLPRDHASAIRTAAAPGLPSPARTAPRRWRSAAGRSALSSLPARL